MKTKDVLHLMPHQIVYCDDLAGTVNLAGYTGLKIEWSNGTAEWVDYGDDKRIAEISLFPSGDK